MGALGTNPVGTRIEVEVVQREVDHIDMDLLPVQVDCDSLPGTPGSSHLFKPLFDQLTELLRPRRQRVFPQHSFPVLSVRCCQLLLPVLDQSAMPSMACASAKRDSCGSVR